MKEFSCQVSWTIQRFHPFVQGSRKSLSRDFTVLCNYFVVACFCYIIILYCIAVVLYFGGAQLLCFSQIRKDPPNFPS